MKDHVHLLVSERRDCPACRAEVVSIRTGVLTIDMPGTIPLRMQVLITEFGDGTATIATRTDDHDTWGPGSWLTQEET